LLWVLQETPHYCCCGLQGAFNHKIM